MEPSLEFVAFVGCNPIAPGFDFNRQAAQDCARRVKENQMAVEQTTRPPLPPFTRESAMQKIRL